MTAEEIAAFLKSRIEPLADQFYGDRYRASAVLRDGVYLPCVVFESRRRRIDLAAKRFKETDGDRGVIEAFVTGLVISPLNIDRVELSPFSWPLSLLRTIRGETAMSWTAFAVEMKDGAQFSYGTTFSTEFFDLPPPYGQDDIKVIHSGMICTDAEGLVPWTLDRHKAARILRERPYFTCYLKDL